VTNPDEFSREDIESLLDAVEARLRDRGVAATVYIVGGAAIALRGVSSDRRTADVDALMVPEDDVLEAAREVAIERGIRATWLNSSARPYVPPLPEEAKQLPAGPGLERHTASDEHLLAMKIIAARGHRDMRDIIPLAQRLGLASPEDLFQLVCGVYGDDAIEHVHGGRKDLLLNCQAVARTLSLHIDSG
jgi:hypothetical protein